MSARNNGDKTKIRFANFLTTRSFQFSCISKVKLYLTCIKELKQKFEFSKNRSFVFCCLKDCCHVVCKNSVVRLDEYIVLM